MSIKDTIAAIATPPGRGGIAIVRVSGPEALNVAKILTNTTPTPRQAYFRQFRYQNEIVDEGVLIYFSAPNSYTGEDVIELQGHGGNVAPHRVLNAVLSVDGVRMALPGEFTRRAFLNNKMDLTAAEAVEDLISAGTESAAKAAIASLDGKFSEKLNELTDELTNFRMRLEGCLDFPEEHEDFFDSGHAIKDLEILISKAQEALHIAKQGVKLNEGARIVLSGAPNAGKSSLLNALAGVEKAIVTNIPGTTRDVLSADIEIEGVPVTITDTAGIRDTPSDEIEAIGIKKATDEVKKSDLILFMVDGSSKAPEAKATLEKIYSLGVKEDHILLVISKIDKKQDKDTQTLLNTSLFSALNKVYTSTKLDDGLKNLRAELTKALGIIPSETVFSARRRHTKEIELTLDQIKKGKEILEFGDLVLCAQQMREAQDHLGTITGAVTSDDLLGKIFSSFCIGK